ncbi:MAG: hypothetical protein HXL58_00160 [Solobacterium sp.]|jgi:hypothetical protein|nr:hypothetical protein [Solobacterium sp.]MBF1762685.1 hypothetical protein [Veillonella sp.]DAO53446.1 MAG TPA: hypothetical protein [Caudoviricetes sp.]DAO62684.1 MAG TPA: hypothetical protein [Caudoviricetes sp.]DAQ09004.1 MAG TPA: hypothetical protein [Caudoviricetes sp.]
MLSKKRKMVITIEIPLNVETQEEASQQMQMILNADVKTFESLEEIIKVYKGTMCIEQKI